MSTGTDLIRELGKLPMMGFLWTGIRDARKSFNAQNLATLDRGWFSVCVFVLYLSFLCLCVCHCFKFQCTGLGNTGLAMILHLTCKPLWLSLISHQTAHLHIIHNEDLVTIILILDFRFQILDFRILILDFRILILDFRF